MTAVDLATKTCSQCGETKPLSEYHRNRGTPDGLRYECKPCVNARTRAWQQAERERMGENAYLAHQAEIVRRSRQNPAVRERERHSQKAYRAAERRLREAHPDEFAALLAQERYERGLT